VLGLQPGSLSNSSVLCAGAYTVSPVSEARNGARALQMGAGCPRLAYYSGQ
jgi:hypothetical protein